MVDNQHQKITGYRDLSQDDIDLMNSFKAMGEQMEEKIELLKAMPNIDQRWLAIAKTDLQKGFMSLIRSIAKPTTFIFAAFLLSSCSIATDLIGQAIGDSIRSSQLTTKTPPIAPLPK